MADRLTGEIKTAQEMKAHIASGELSGCYLLFGEELYLKELYLGRLKNLLADDSINVITYTGEFDPEEIREEIDGISLFGEKKLIVIRDSGLFKKASDVSFLEGAACGGTAVVFSETEVDRRSAAFKAFLKTGVVFECARQDEAAVKKLLTSDAARAGRILTPDAADLLVSGVGNDIVSLKNELEKLILTVPEGGRIEEKHVREVCELSLNARIFDLTDAVSRGDTGTALKLLHALTDGARKDKSSALGILTMLGRNWENLLGVKMMLSEGMRESEIGAATGQKPYPVRKQCEQCRRFTEAELRKKLKDIMELDQAIKVGDIDESLALELAVTC